MPIQWKQIHKRECPAVPSLAGVLSGIALDEALLLLRVLIQLGSSSGPLTDCDIGDVLTMPDHETPERVKGNEPIVQLVWEAARLIKATAYGKDEVARLLCAMQVCGGIGYESVPWRHESVPRARCVLKGEHPEGMRLARVDG